MLLTGQLQRRRKPLAGRCGTGLSAVMGKAGIRPFHVEAYPRLELREARRRVRGGDDCLVWYDQGGTLVGTARLAFAGGKLAIEARFRSLFYIPHGVFRDELTYTAISRAGDEDDVLTICRHCELPRRSVVFLSGTWLCGDCQRLVHRSTIVSKHVRDTDRLAELDRKIGAGRPRYTRAVGYNELKRERAELHDRLDGNLAKPPAHQQWVLGTHWMPSPTDLLHDAASGGESAAESDTLHDAALAGNSAAADLLELLGTSLFYGPSLAQRVERKLRGEVGPAYREARLLAPKVTALQIRRRITPAIIGTVPVLGEPEPIRVSKVRSREELKAELAVPFVGDPELFRARVPHPTIELFPAGAIRKGKLVLAALFAPENLPFVPALLGAELDLVREALAQQEAAARAVRIAFPRLLKEVVDRDLPRVKPRRRKRG